MKSLSLFAIAIVAAQPAIAIPSTGSAVAEVAAAMRSATVVPARQGYVNAMQVYAFADGAIYQAFTAPGAITDIALQPGEGLIAVASGDTVRWIIGDTTSGQGESRRVHILVKPTSAGLATSLVITTDRRAYHLRLTSTAVSTMAGIRWSYPQDEMLALKKAVDAAEAAAPVASGVAIDKLDFNYAISGDKPAWRPLRAFDDGRQTYIEFARTLGAGEVPPLFALGADDAVELVNYRQRGRFYIVDRIFDRAELRFGLKRQTIVRITRHASRARGL
nr:P-type conjugative transfer protein TrbG [Sphingomonas sp. Y57]